MVSSVDPCPQLVIDYFAKKFVKHEEPVPDKYDIRVKLTRDIGLSLLFIPLQNATFEINKCLNSITFTSEAVVINSFGDICYRDVKEFDEKIKVILLKLHLGEITMKNFRNSLNSKEKQLDKVSEEVPKTEEKPQKKNLNLNYMGDNPQVVFESVEPNVEIKIILSTAPAKICYNDKYPEMIELSHRLLSRLQLILDLVNRVKIFEEPNKLLKHITDEETKLGKIIILNIRSNCMIDLYVITKLVLHQKRQNK